MFLEDRRSERLTAYCREVRNHWWKALQHAQRERPNSPFYSERFALVWTSICTHVPDLSEWKDDYWTSHSDRGQAHLASLFAIFCSVAHSAEQGKDTLYITRHSGDGALLAMLNSKFSGADFLSYANLLQAFLMTTPLAGLLDRPSLQKILGNARDVQTQINSAHVVWQAVARMFPETLDGLVRAELIDLGQLPAWACNLDDRSPEHG